MKMIDVYMKISNFDINPGAKLIIDEYTFDYVKRWLSETSLSYRFEDGNEKTLEDYYDIDLKFLNKEVELIPPEKRKYYLRVNEYVLDFKNYINRRNEDFGVSSYIINDNKEVNGYHTKFTQSEIDDDQFLKFVEKHGVKEEVTDNEK